MLRRVASFLVILGHVAGQLAAVPHGHADIPQCEHSTQPHIHLAWLLGSSHEHQHHHDAEGRADHRHRGDDTRGGHGGLDDASDHDADAIYMPGAVSMSVADGSGASQIFAGAAAAPTVVLVHVVGIVEADDAPLIRAPAEFMPGYRVCLALRALRI